MNCDSITTMIHLWNRTRSTEKSSAFYTFTSNNFVYVFKKTPLAVVFQQCITVKVINVWWSILIYLIFAGINSNYNSLFAHKCITADIRHMKTMARDLHKVLRTLTPEEKGTLKDITVVVYDSKLLPDFLRTLKEEDSTASHDGK